MKMRSRSGATALRCASPPPSWPRHRSPWTRPVLAFYDLRRRNLLNAKPNAAHFALARLEATLAQRGVSLTLVTQNLDDLHERAGSRRVTHMHGELLKARCGLCEAVR